MSGYEGQVVIVGRKNVGKSTLFNRLSVNVKSITFDYPGVTRDLVKDKVSWADVTFSLIDTGGVSLRKSGDPLEERVRQIALDAIERSELILFVVDSSVGIVPEDQEIASLLHKLGKDIIVIANKIDHSAAQEHQYEFVKLGFKEIIPISAEHAKGIADILDAIVQFLKSKKTVAQPKEPAFRVVLLGKPNVGKSSLMNLLLQQERSIVAEKPGTTREAISESIDFYKETILLTDTPGIRRRRGIGEPLEKVMVKTSFRAVERADIVLLMIDESELRLSDQERKLAFYAFEQQLKALILLINKDDLVGEEERSFLEHDFEQYKFLLHKIPQLFISCKSGKNIGKIIPLISEIWKHYNREFSEEELTYLFKEALQHRQLFHKTIPLKIKKARQIKKGPITIVLHVNYPQWFGPSQLAFFENRLRKTYSLQGVPIKFIPRV